MLTDEEIVRAAYDKACEDCAEAMIEVTVTREVESFEVPTTVKVKGQKSRMPISELSQESLELLIKAWVDEVYFVAAGKKVEFTITTVTG